MNDCPIPGARGFQRPSGTCSNRVMILGEACGKEEANESRGFVEYAQAGSVLERAIRRLGMNREQFLLWNVVPTQPPNNWLEGAPWEAEAIAWGRPYLEEMIAKYQPRAILALGSVATRVTTGLAGYKLGVSSLTGFVLPSPYGPVVPCFHPSYLRRGAMGLLGVLMRSIKVALAVASGQQQVLIPPVDSPPEGYILHPTEEQAHEYLSRSGRYLAYDIETPWSNAEESAEEAEGEQAIKSIQFSLQAGGGIFLPWRDPYKAIAAHALASDVPKLSWNGWHFDDPVLKANGLTIGGESHDLMWAWHHLQPDLPRGLQFAAAQQGWPWPWKHLDRVNPQFYGIVDADVLQWMVR